MVELVNIIGGINEKWFLIDYVICVFLVGIWISINEILVFSIKG